MYMISEQFQQDRITYRIQPNYRTVRLDFSRLLKTLQ